MCNAGNDERTDEATSSPPATAVDNERESVLERHVGEELSSDPAGQQQSGETTVRARFPQPQSDEGEGDESLCIRLILPNNSTININAQRSTTLGDLRRLYK